MHKNIFILHHKGRRISKVISLMLCSFWVVEINILTHGNMTAETKESTVIVLQKNWSKPQRKMYASLVCAVDFYGW